MEQTNIERQKISEMQFDHFAIIISNLSIAGLVLILSVAGISILSLFFYLLYFFILFAIAICTLFTIFVTHPEFFNFEGGNFISSIINGLVVALPYISIATMVFSILSTVLLLSQKQKKHKARLVFSIIAIIIATLALVATSTGMIDLIKAGA